MVPIFIDRSSLPRPASAEDLLRALGAGFGRADVVLAATCGHAGAREALGEEAPAALEAPVFEWTRDRWPGAFGLGGPVAVTVGALALALDMFHFGSELADFLHSEGAGRQAGALDRRLDEVRPTLERVRSWCEAGGALPGVRLPRGPLPAWHHSDQDHRDVWRSVAADVSEAAESVANCAGESRVLPDATTWYGNFVGRSAARTRDPLARGYYVAAHLQRLWRSTGPPDPERPPDDRAICGICHRVVTEALVGWALWRDLPGLGRPRVARR